MSDDVCGSTLPISLEYNHLWRSIWSRTAQALDEVHILDLEDEAIRDMSDELEPHGPESWTWDLGEVAGSVGTSS